MRSILALTGILLAGAVLGAPADAGRSGYLFRVVGRVVSADRARGTLVLQHGQMETKAPGRERCQAPPSVLAHVRPGMTITATADTSHRPWRLLDVRPFRPGDERLVPGRGTIAMREPRA